MNGELFDLTGKTALVTGSSRGLGFVFARGLAHAGATVVLNGRNTETLQQAVSQLEKEGFAAEGYAFDVVDKKQLSEQVSRIEKQIGPVDILVNSAGIQKRAPILDMEESVWREVLEVNLNGVFLTSKIVGRGMVQRRRGKIINICSVLSEVGRPTIAPYTAAKGGVKMLTRALAVEWAEYNVQVNGLGPGYFATEMNKALVEDRNFDSWIRRRTPAGRWGKPEELIGAVVFLASRASDFVTGQILYVDGGILASL
jgi:gluconate 5-dehydrogenase